MAKFPYLTSRRGTKNFYYKRLVPLELRCEGRPEQIWRSLRTSDWKEAERTYADQHAKIELLFDQWRRKDSATFNRFTNNSGWETKAAVTPLTPGLLRRLSDVHYVSVYDADFQWRGDLWQKVREDEDAFWRGDIIKLPEDDWHEFRGKPHSYFAYLMEEPFLEDVFLYSIFRARKVKLQGLQRRYQLGDSRNHGPIADSLLRSKEISLSDADRSRFMRKLVEVEIKALEDLTAGNEASFDGIVERQATAESPIQSVPAAKPGALMSQLIEKYLDDTGRPATIE